MFRVPTTQQQVAEHNPAPSVPMKAYEAAAPRPPATTERRVEAAPPALPPLPAQAEMLHHPSQHLSAPATSSPMQRPLYPPEQQGKGYHQQPSPAISDLQLPLPPAPSPLAPAAQSTPRVPARIPGGRPTSVRSQSTGRGGRKLSNYALVQCNYHL